MNPEVLEILARLESIDLEAMTLRKRLTEILTGTDRTDDCPDFSMFKDTTRRLLIELWDAPEKMISNQDIREDVMFNEDADGRALRKAISIVRKELAQGNHRQVHRRETDKTGKRHRLFHLP